MREENLTWLISHQTHVSYVLMNQVWFHITLFFLTVQSSIYHTKIVERMSEHFLSESKWEDLLMSDQIIWWQNCNDCCNTFPQQPLIPDLCVKCHEWLMKVSLKDESWCLRAGNITAEGLWKPDLNNDTHLSLSINNVPLHQERGDHHWLKWWSLSNLM